MLKERNNLFKELQRDKTNKMTCAPSKDSDQPGYPPSLISLRCTHEKKLGSLAILRATAKSLVRLGGYSGRSESSLGPYVILLVLSCAGSNIIPGITINPINDCDRK